MFLRFCPFTFASGSTSGTLSGSASGFASCFLSGISSGLAWVLTSAFLSGVSSGLTLDLNFCFLSETSSVFTSCFLSEISSGLALNLTVCFLSEISSGLTFGLTSGIFLLLFLFFLILSCCFSFDFFVCSRVEGRVLPGAAIQELSSSLHEPYSDAAAAFGSATFASPVFDFSSECTHGLSSQTSDPCRK